jgi:hypothetical protein
LSRIAKHPGLRVGIDSAIACRQPGSFAASTSTCSIFGASASNSGAFAISAAAIF